MEVSLVLNHWNPSANLSDWKEFESKGESDQREREGRAPHVRIHFSKMCVTRVVPFAKMTYVADLQ